MQHRQPRAPHRVFPLLWLVLALALALVGLSATACASTAPAASPEGPKVAHRTLVRGLVVDSTGAPVPDAIVVATRLGCDCPPTRDGVVTDARGWFEIPGLAPGDYTFAAISAAHAPATSGLLPVSESAFTELEIVLDDSDVIQV